MSRLTAKIKRDLPLRISLMIVLAMSLLLTVTLFIMLYFSHHAMKEDALNRAAATLERTTTNIDNILLSVEETAGNIYFNMKYDDPEKMYTYARKIVETNPYITGCAIAFKPGFYKNRPLFMAYEHRVDSIQHNMDHDLIVRSDSFGTKPYTEQVWYIRPMTLKRVIWLNPLAGMESNIEPLISFCAPIPGVDGEPVGVISVDVSISLLSEIIASNRPSSNSYCALLDHDGSFIVDPTAGYLTKLKATSLPGESVREAVKIMMSGDKGYTPFKLNDRTYYLFYKPFVMAEVPNRYLSDLGWSIGIAFSEDDIFGEYNALFNYVIIISIVGMIMMFLYALLIIRHRLKPLKTLTLFAERIAQGHYDEPLPTRHRNKDEIGILQSHFHRMQRSIASNIGELHQLTETIQDRSKELQAAYNQAKKSDHMKTDFMHNMTDQMIKPANAIGEDVTALNHFDKTTTPERINEIVVDIQKNGNTITQLLNNLIHLSEDNGSENYGQKGGEP